MASRNRPLTLADINNVNTFLGKNSKKTSVSNTIGVVDNVNNRNDISNISLQFNNDNGENWANKFNQNNGTNNGPDNGPNSPHNNNAPAAASKKPKTRKQQPKNTNMMTAKEKRQKRAQEEANRRDRNTVQRKKNERKSVEKKKKSRNVKRKEERKQKRNYANEEAAAFAQMAAQQEAEEQRRMTEMLNTLPEPAAAPAPSEPNNEGPSREELIKRGKDALSKARNNAKTKKKNGKSREDIARNAAKAILKNPENYDTQINTAAAAIRNINRRVGTIGNMNQIGRTENAVRGIVDEILAKTNDGKDILEKRKNLKYQTVSSNREREAVGAPGSKKPNASSNSNNRKKTKKREKEAAKNLKNKNKKNMEKAKKLKNAKKTTGTAAKNTNTTVNVNKQRMVGENVLAAKGLRELKKKLKPYEDHLERLEQMLKNKNMTETERKARYLKERGIEVNNSTNVNKLFNKTHNSLIEREVATRERLIRNEERKTLKKDRNKIRELQEDIDQLKKMREIALIKLDENTIKQRIKETKASIQRIKNGKKKDLSKLFKGRKKSKPVSIGNIYPTTNNKSKSENKSKNNSGRKWSNLNNGIHEISEPNEEGMVTVRRIPKAHVYLEGGAKQLTQFKSNLNYIKTLKPSSYRTKLLNSLKKKVAKLYQQ